MMQLPGLHHCLPPSSPKITAELYFQKLKNHCHRRFTWHGLPQQNDAADDRAGVPCLTDHNNLNDAA